MCVGYGGHLATLYSEQQYRDIIRLVNGAWLGMNSIGSPIDPRIFVDANQNKSRPLYTPWSGQIARPGGANGPADANCVAGTPFEFALAVTVTQYSCSERRASVCQIKEQAMELNPEDCIKPVHDPVCVPKKPSVDFSTLGS